VELGVFYVIDYPQKKADFLGYSPQKKQIFGIIPPKKSRIMKLFPPKKTFSCFSLYKTKKTVQLFQLID
jgi:hypothetical protein